MNKNTLLATLAKLVELEEFKVRGSFTLNYYTELPVELTGDAARQFVSQLRQMLQDRNGPIMGKPRNRYRAYVDGNVLYIS